MVAKNTANTCSTIKKKKNQRNESQILFFLFDFFENFRPTSGSISSISKDLIWFNELDEYSESKLFILMNCLLWNNADFLNHNKIGQRNPRIPEFWSTLKMHHALKSCQFTSSVVWKCQEFCNTNKIDPIIVENVRNFAGQIEYILPHSSTV